jgi:hypothetical protein
MRAGEKGILGLIGVVVVGMMAYRAVNVTHLDNERDLEIPFYTTASADLKRDGEILYKRHNCSDCHSLWMVRNMLESIPAPPLDGIGSLRDEKWFYDYLSAPNPQQILPSRLKPEFRMPSYADLPEQERHTLAGYLSSLKVRPWYLDETKKVEFEKLTGKKYQPEAHESNDQK